MDAEASETCEREDLIECAPLSATLRHLHTCGLAQSWSTAVVTSLTVLCIVRGTDVV